MLISVIIPAFNAEKYLAEAIGTVLSQNIELELIIVNDGSTDQTAVIARSFGSKLTLLSQPNEGTASARNCGILQATGDYLSFLDADDLWTENKLQEQLALIKQDPTIDLVFGQVVQFTDTESKKEQYRFSNQPIPGYTAGTLLVKRTTFLSVGLFCTEYRIGEFIDWYARATAMNLRSFVSDKIFLKRRIHGKNTTIVHRTASVDYLQHLKKLLDRKRSETDADHTATRPSITSDS